MDSLVLQKTRGVVLSFILVAWVLALPSPSYGDLTQLGRGGYTTELPAGQRGPSNNQGDPAKPVTSSEWNQAPQTNQWWSSLIWKFDPGNRWSQNLFAYPLAFRASELGLALSYTTKYTISQPTVVPGKGQKVREYHYPFQQDLRVGVEGLRAAETKVASYSDWAVTATWESGKNSLRATIGRGLPFAYFTKSGRDAQIHFSQAPKIWFKRNGVVGLTINGNHYGVFGPTGSDWIAGLENTLSSDLDGKNYFSVAILPNDSLATLETYRKHAYAFVVDTKASWNYDPESAELTSHFEVKTELKEASFKQSSQQAKTPLLALFRHQWLNTQSNFTEYSYVSPRGEMKVVEDSRFSTVMKFNGVLPALPLVARDGVDGFQSQKLKQYIDDIYKVSPAARWGVNESSDSYWSAKAYGKFSLLIPIADQVGATGARDVFLSELKAKIEYWLTGTKSQKFYYDRTWRTLIAYPASYGTDRELNDHHFHYGYFVQAAATIAQYDPNWASQDQWGGMIELLIKDAANSDRNDNRFPFLRQFDVYGGHSWANGPALFAAGNNQESSSESINFATGLIRWGVQTNQPKLRDLGIFLYTTEVAAIEQYWFDIDRQVFPSEFNEPTLGIVWGDGGAYSIWWWGNVEELHGINFLPITGGSLYLGKNPDYLAKNHDFMMKNAGGSGMWRDIHMGVKALYDPAAALREFDQNSNYTPEAGESKAHTYHWLHNLNKLGRVDTSVTADIATYGVFNKNGLRRYVAYNPEQETITVHFSDGVQLRVEPNQVSSSISKGKGKGKENEMPGK